MKFPVTLFRKSDNKAIWIPTEIAYTVLPNKGEYSETPVTIIEEKIDTSCQECKKLKQEIERLKDRLEFTKTRLRLVRAQKNCLLNGKIDYNSIAETIRHKTNYGVGIKNKIKKEIKQELEKELENEHNS